MKESIKVKIDRMVEYYQNLRTEYKWSSNDMSLRFSAFAYVLANKELRMEHFKEQIRYVKKCTGVFSFHRASQMLPEAALLLTHFEDGKKAFDTLVKYENMMKEEGFKNSQYLSIAAYSLMLSCQEELTASRIRRAMDIYRKIKESHYWLTTSDDYPVAVLLAGEEGNIDEINNRIEDIYKGLHVAGFHRGNGLQYLSHLLTFNPEDQDLKISRCRTIYDKLKAHKLKVSSMYYGVIGFLAMLDQEADEALYDVVETMDYLSSIKGFKLFYKELNLILVSALVNDEYMEARKNNLLETGVHMSVQMMIAAQQAALIAASSAASAAAGASS